MNKKTGRGAKKTGEKKRKFWGEPWGERKEESTTTRRRKRGIHPNGVTSLEVLLRPFSLAFFPFPSSLMSFRRSIHAFAALPHIRFGGQLGDVIVPSSELVPLLAKNIPGRSEGGGGNLPSVTFQPGEEGFPL